MACCSARSVVSEEVACTEIRSTSPNPVMEFSTADSGAMMMSSGFVNDAPFSSCTPITVKGAPLQEIR